MSFLTPTDLEQYNIETAAPGTTQLVPDSWFDGVPKGVLQGVVGAAAGVGQLGMDVANTFPTTQSAGQKSPRFNPFSTRSTATSFNNFRDAPPQARSELSKSIQSTLDEMRAYSKIDPRVQGGGAGLAAGLTRGLLLGGAGFAAGGAPGAAALLGSTEADTAYHDAKEQGLNDTTAYELSALAGVTNAAGAFLPMAAGGAGLRGLAQSLLTGAGINVTVGAANRAATSQILEANGYTDMARQYEAADASAMAADALLGAAFGGLGHMGKARDPSDIHAATEALKGEHIDRGGPGLPTTPEAAQAHIDELANAIHAIDRGRAVDVDAANADTLARQTVADPEAMAIQRQATQQLLAEEPGAEALAKPVDVPEMPWTSQPYKGLIPEVDAAALAEYERKSSAYFAETGEYLPLPSHLDENLFPRPEAMFTDKTGRGIRIKMTPDGVIEAYDGERRIAELAIEDAADGARVVGAQFTDPEYQRQGIMTALHWFAKKNVARYSPTHEAPVYTQDGQLLKAHLEKVDFSGESPLRAAPAFTMKEGETGPAVSPQAITSLEALVKSHPDLEITLDDGRVAKVSELPELFQQQMTEARKLSVLHDVAAACFMGTE